jgi:hypothetical protein
MLLDRNFEDFSRRASELDAGETVELRDYPISIPLTRDEAAAMDRDALRETLLSRSVDAMYRDGTDALRDQEASGGPGRFTTSGFVRRALDVLRSDVHDVMLVVTIILAVTSALLAGWLAAMTRRFARLTAVGFVVLCAGLPMLVLSVATRVNASVTADDDTEYVQRELLELGEALVWIPIRNGLAFCALGLAFLVIGLAASRWERSLAARTADGEKSPQTS